MQDLLHIAIIMDGNGRWAKSQGKQRIAGHEKGAEVVREITTYCSNVPQITSLTLYAFSTENWKRPKAEVEFLMQLLSKYLKKELDVYLANNVRFKAIGDLSALSKKLQTIIAQTEEKTAHCSGLTQYLAINYGAQDEIARAARKVAASGREITQENITQALDMPYNIDILIRTGGDQRISNFLLWQASYAELFFTPTMWPDFNAQELEKIISKFHTIERRFGGL